MSIRGDLRDLFIGMHEIVGTMLISLLSLCSLIITGYKQMRLTPETVRTAPVYLNPLKQREISLRGKLSIFNPLSLPRTLMIKT